MDAISVARANVEHSRMIREALKEAIPFMAIPAISLTLIEVVKTTWQDSSNAAFNWYVISPDHSSPAYREFFGHPPVGAINDKRTVNKKDGDINMVAYEVYKREYPKIKQVYSRRHRIDLSLYNAVEDSGSPEYPINAEIYKSLHDPEVTVAFDKNTALKFSEWKSRYGF